MNVLGQNYLLNSTLEYFHIPKLV